MFVCRLFPKDRPGDQIDARLLVEGRMTLGRGSAADWIFGDWDAQLSRIHCSLEIEDGRLHLRDLSSNGVFINDVRVEKNSPIELGDQQSFILGDLCVRVDRLGADQHLGLVTAEAEPQSPFLEASTPESPPLAPSHPDASLLEAFFDGARIDPSTMSSEDPVELMRRAGAIYRHTVAALTQLLADRARVKAHFDLERTTIGAVDNNPFKWTPARKLAQDLLRGEEAGFLAEGAAVEASFADVARHLKAMSAGADAMVEFVMARLDPADVEREALAQKGLLKNPSSLCWQTLQRRHAALTALEGKAARMRAFGEAYDQAVDSIEGSQGALTDRSVG